MGNSIVAFDAHKVDDGIHLEDSEGESVLAKNFDTIAKFLLEDYDDEDREITYLKVCYDLNEFAEIIFKTLPAELVEQFQGGQTKVKYQDYKIFYIPSKMLGISAKFRVRIKGNFYKEETYEAVLYHLKQFCPDNKVVVPVEDAKDLGMELLVQLKRMGLIPTRLVSPVSIYDECVLSRMLVPRACNIPEEAVEALEYAMQGMNREWRSAYQLGYWEQAFDYDINACYPSIIAELRDIRSAKWHKSGQEEECDWGIMKGMVTINSDISPIICEDNTLRVGTWEEMITTEDVEFIRKYGIGEFKIIDGWFMNYGIKDCYPFEVVMNRLFGMRATNEFFTKISKSISVGISGKFGEIKTDGSYGDYFNPIYRLMITDRARLKVAQFIYDNKLQENLIGVMVDGVLADREIKLKGGTLMGNWRLSNSSPALVMSTGYQFVGDKKPGNISLEQMLRAIREHPNKSAYCGIDFSGLDYDREFSEKPKTGGQLMENRYSSKPLVGGKG